MQIISGDSTREGQREHCLLGNPRSARRGPEDVFPGMGDSRSLLAPTYDSFSPHGGSKYGTSQVTGSKTYRSSGAREGPRPAPPRPSQHVRRGRHDAKDLFRAPNATVPPAATEGTGAPKLARAEGADC